MNVQVSMNMDIISELLFEHEFSNLHERSSNHNLLLLQWNQDNGPNPIEKSSSDADFFLKSHQLILDWRIRKIPTKKNALVMKQRLIQFKKWLNDGAVLEIHLAHQKLGCPGAGRGLRRNFRQAIWKAEHFELACQGSSKEARHLNR